MSLKVRPSEPGEVRGQVRPLAHLLIVAGARGAGKTTFIKAVKAGRTDPAILACLPRKTAHWPTLQAWNYASWMPRIAAAAETRIMRMILHCDLVTMGVESLEPALDVLQLARKITAVSIRPDIARLAVQFSARSSQRVAGIANGNLVLPALPADRAGQIHHVEEMRRTVLDLYSEPRWVERLYADWNAKIARLAAGSTFRLIEIQPIEPGPSGVFRWALKHDSASAGRPR